MSLLVLKTAACALFASLALYYRNKSRSRLPLPPGPRKLPLVGNLFNIPPTFQWETYMEWSKKYDSDIIHLDVAGTSMIVLSSAAVANDLLEKRSAVYSDRGPAPIVTELSGWDFLIGDYWRFHRRLIHHEFHAAAVRAFHPRERAATHDLLRRLLNTPDDFMGHLRQMAGEVIMSVAYSIQVRPSHDPYIALTEKALAAVPGKFLVDSIPLLKYIPEWFPGAGFKRQARVCKQMAQAMVEMPFAEAKRNIAAGTSVPCFTTYGLRSLDKYDAPEARTYREKIVKETVGTMYVAGADTTVSALGTFILGMLANPDAQCAAQREIDTVVGDGRLPDFADESALPLVMAIMKEVLRWKNVTPTKLVRTSVHIAFNQPSAIPHFLPVEDEYRGFRLPANSVVIPNIWAILHDETIYPDPYAFKPERFLLNGKLNPAVRSPDAAFGFGRRICLGRHLARDSLWITIASILAAFDITKAMDDDGRVIEPTFDIVPGMVCFPAPFKCAIKPRSGRAVELVWGTLDEEPGV